MRRVDHVIRQATREYMAELSVVVVNWNTRELLAQCLASVYAHPPSCDFEVWVVDNASSDASVSMVRAQFPQVRLIDNHENVGFARANNQAMRLSTGRYALLLNSDAQVCPGALETMVAFMRMHPRAGAAGPRLLNPDGSLQPLCHPMTTLFREFWHLLHLDAVRRLSVYDMAAWDQSQPRLVDVVSGACLVLRREAVDQIGLLAEELFMYAEEVDICYRLSRGDWEVYWVPVAQVVHFGGASTRQVSDEMFLQLYRSKYLFIKKTHGWLGAQAFKWMLLAASVGRVLVGSVEQRLVGPRKPSAAKKTEQYRRLIGILPSL